MRGTLKIAISLPKEDLEKIEKIRKKTGSGRSAIIDEAIRFWLGRVEEEESVKKYRQGYLKKPESADELKALEKEQAAAFAEEGLE